ncbi:hypothetical protein H2202_004855 [Exophiala xenobiotica]|nr:hypothetical protein H2202_004855 [Exophiala xenobiotica]KAK5197140.1 hypothetical protein LTR92_003078 [Exophiala xenobiotica]KAK5213512.1 hypothetical protein LTR41_001091 [Exophiala xenobiotica]KAK5231186.1 hypothetical protein LTR72_000366 [Exophiala xenobiotica]KAK5299700.1 hypothetical protein LTR14_001914 [Exophiala xenobiotica]
MSSSTPPQPQSQPYTLISPNSTADLDRFMDIITDSFANTALTTSFIVDNDNTPPPYPSPLIDADRRRRHFAQGILDSAASNAELVHAGDWSAIALWETPQYQGKAFIDSKSRPGILLGEWRAKVKAAKEKHLTATTPMPSRPSDSTPSIDVDSSETTPNSTPGDSDNDNDTENEPPSSLPLRPYYHLSFLARNTAIPKVSGSINAVMLPFLQRAKAENAPAWLEATTPQAVKIYEHFGFRIAEQIVVGKGKIDHEGWPTVDGKGEGVTAWAMIYD